MTYEKLYHLNTYKENENKNKEKKNKLIKLLNEYVENNNQHGINK
jgi:hypothetical protein